MDGARYSETWGDTTHQYIPNLVNEIARKGVVCHQFYNNGHTYTVSGHAAITTAIYQEIDNGGMESPQYPSIFQYWLESNDKDSTSAWIISSKDKLEVLADCNVEMWKGKNNPSTNCGIDGLGVGSGYRHDSLTYMKTIDILSHFHPQLTLVNFREPDYSAHNGDWDNYVNGIIETDKYIYKIWQFVESDPIYSGKTTLFVTNDHGRHLDGVADGFSGHGDNCEGCRRINLFAIGPDFKKGYLSGVSRNLIDIPSTVAELLNFRIANNQGEVMKEIFE